MNIFARLKIGLGMARRSGRLLRASPKLLVFPLVGGLSGVAFLLTLFGGLIAGGSLLEEPGAALYGGLFVAYLVETFITSFFTAVLMAATRDIFDGKRGCHRTLHKDLFSLKRVCKSRSIEIACVSQ